MKPIVLNSSNIAVQTSKNLKHFMGLETAFGKAFQLETLKKRMMRGEVVKFAYQKKDGSIRYACGTLQSDAVEANIWGYGIPKRFFNQFAYLDLQKMQWRSFKAEKFIGIVD